VTISVSDSDGHNYHKDYTLSGVKLTHQQVINVQLERGWERYNTRTRSLKVFPSSLDMNGDYANSVLVKKVFSKPYDIELLVDDFNSLAAFNTIVVFRIDSTCSIVDRSIESEVEPMAETVITSYLNQGQSELRQKLSACEARATMKTPVIYKLSH
jgi:hypothetical protein